MPSSDWRTKTVQGNIDSVTRRTSTTGKEYGAVIIGGDEYSSWNELLTAQAESLIDNFVAAEVRNKQGSKFWTLQDLAPGDLNTVTTQHSPSRANSVLPAPSPSDIRVKAVELAILAMSKAPDTAQALTDPEALLAYSRALESYLLGQDLVDLSA